MASSPDCPICTAGPLRTFGERLGQCRECRTVVVNRENRSPKDGNFAWASPESERAKIRIYRAGLDFLERSVPGRKLLDVGAGFGTFISEAVRRGWKAEGVEADRGYAAVLSEKGIKVHAGTLEDYPGEGGFDAVTFWDALEAFPDPVSALARARALLKPGGVLFLRTRNGPVHLFVRRILDPVLKPLLGATVVFHRFGFGDRTFGPLFRRAGFELLSVRNSPLSEGDPYGGARGLLGAWIGLIKRMLYFASEAAAFAAAGKLHVSPTLLAAARRPAEAPSVLHLITRLDPGGSAECTRDLARDLEDPRFGLLLAAGGDSPPGAEAISVRNLVRNPSWRDAAALWEIFRLLRRLRPRVLHTHSSKAGFLGRLAAAAAGVPSVAHTPHGHVFYGYFGAAKSRFYRLLERACVPLTDRFVALTEGEKRESVSAEIGLPDRWAVIPSGTPLDPGRAPGDKAALRGALGLEPGALWVGSLLRLERVKGPDLLIEAAALIGDGGRLRFVLIGDGPMRKILEKRIAELGLGGRVVLAGHQGDIWPWLDALDIYAQPSRNEGMGRALVQAQSAGLPVAASRVCGIPDVAPEGVSSILVPPEDPEALASAIGRLAADADLRARLGAGGRDWVFGTGRDGLRRFGPEAMVEGHRALYADILKEWARGRQ